jgi:hypothetical protein
MSTTNPAAWLRGYRSRSTEHRTKDPAWRTLQFPNEHPSGETFCLKTLRRWVIDSKKVGRKTATKCAV